ncbi:proline-rich receptor-like protein kinase PERK1 [Arachis stenosperma]|uniref:proline-rich receptor-like protein kinase PERK1 n=1 Tax=Arachis stenosperma TaxID=217475 RepID=UPI0025AC1245|nr:proline-rich receptor-like protein kinase PERK1 [Arachis stenosperma]
MKIVVETAKRLVYLHDDCHPNIIHRNIKAANILLDFNFEVKVTNFGLAKLCSNVTRGDVYTRMMGTVKYLALEYVSSGILTKKADVFSFGVMLLELITGRQPIDSSHTFVDVSSVGWIKVILRKENCLETIEGRPTNTPDDKWKEIEGNTVTNLYLAMANSVLSSISKKPITKKIWEALTKLHEAKSLHNRIFMKGGSIIFKMNVLNFFSKIYQTRMINITNNNIVDQLRFDDVVATILEEESRYKNKDDQTKSSKQAGALSVMRDKSTERGSSESQCRGRSRSRKKNFTC